MNAAGIPTHDFKTNQIVESMNGIFVDARRDAPNRLCAKILKWMGTQLEVRVKSITKWIEE